MDCEPTQRSALGHTASHIRTVDHVALAVESLAEAAAFFQGVLGARFLCGGDNDDTGLRLMHLALPGLKLELMQPLRAGSPLAAGLRKRGPGFHHMTFLVDDVASTAYALHCDGFEPIDTDTRFGAWSETFLSARSTFGALLQFVSTDLHWDRATSDYSADDVMAGRVVWRDYIACLRRPEERMAATPRNERSDEL